MTSQEVAKVRSQRLDTQYIDLTQFMPHDEALCLIPREKAIELSILPLMIQNEKLFISIDERADYKHKNYLESISQRSIQFVISSKKEILNHLMTHEYYTKDDAIRDQINILKSKSYEDTDIINLVDLLIEDAIDDSVSDIHISPEKDVVNVFFRVDGVLVHYHTLPKEFQERIISRIKILSSQS